MLPGYSDTLCHFGFQKIYIYTYLIGIRGFLFPNMFPVIVSQSFKAAFLISLIPVITKTTKR